MPSDYNQMLAKEDLDAVYISIPPFAHGAPERAVIHAGLAMFVEKPVHMDTKDAREISQMVNKAGIITAAGYQERYLDILDKAKELLKNRRIGFFMGYWMGAVCQVGGGVRRKNLGGRFMSRLRMRLIWRVIFSVRSKQSMRLTVVI